VRRRHGKTHSESPDNGDVPELRQEDRLETELLRGCMQGAEEGGGQEQQKVLWCIGVHEVEKKRRRGTEEAEDLT
jgi:hypothetical protein